MKRNRRLPRSALIRTGAGLARVCLILFLLIPGFLRAEEKFVENFDRPDGTDIGEGWTLVPDQHSCINLDGPSQKTPITPKDGKGIQEGHKLFAEISQEIEAAAGKAARGGKGSGGSEGFGGSGPQLAEISNGMLYLHFDSGQRPVSVQRIIDKKIMRLSADITPLYAMGGEDDRAWMLVRITYLDHENRPLGEIRYYHYNAVLDEYVHSSTVHSVMVKENFDGELRHIFLDAGAILKSKLVGVDPNQIARTGLSFEVSSNVCGATVEGYVDNVSADLADAAGLRRFTKDELKALVLMGVKLHAQDPGYFSKSWVDAVIRIHGREKIVAWLSEIPQATRTNPDKLLGMIRETYGFTGQLAFDTAFIIQYLLHAM
ncbi:MAG: hypothetical protein HQL07_11405 [Nitrospirae bacterium]|nr:hypothetical protein [Magnetococcales bacterium]HAT50001.1 hypothetical protein [Alphaproteobacteria bacterium]